MSPLQTDAPRSTRGINGDGANGEREAIILSNGDLLLVGRPARRERLELAAVEIRLIPWLHSQQMICRVSACHLAELGEWRVSVSKVRLLLRLIVQALTKAFAFTRYVGSWETSGVGLLAIFDLQSPDSSYIQGDIDIHIYFTRFHKILFISLS